MTPEELVEQIQTALPGKLQSAVLYGSAVAGDFVPEASNYNVLLVVDPLGIAELTALVKPTARWIKLGNRPPLLFTAEQLKASADVFPIELLDIRQSHRMLFGPDPVADMVVEPECLRLQLERELKEKLLALREQYLLSGGESQDVAGVIVASVGGFLVLARAALRLFQEDVPSVKVDAIRLLAERLDFDPQPILDIDALRRRKRKWRETIPQPLCESYLTSIERLTAAIDRHLHRRS